MNYHTRDFGKLEIRKEEILTFVQPIFGFEEYKQFAIIQNEQIGDAIVWLQSLDEPGVCFILFDPTPLAGFFQPQIPDSVSHLLGEGDYICWVMCTVPGDIQQMTVNLKSPLLINPANQMAAQVILEQDYPVRFPLLKGGNASCS